MKKNSEIKKKNTKVHLKKAGFQEENLKEQKLS